MRIIEDPGHSWLEVSLIEYPDALHHGTGYGYVNFQGQVIYLEEDVEAPSFLRAHPEIDRTRFEGVFLDRDWRGRTTLPRNRDYSHLLEGAQS